MGAGRSRVEKERRKRTHINRADEILVSHEHICHGETEEDGQDPGADEPLDRLLGG